MFGYLDSMGLHSNQKKKISIVNIDHESHIWKSELIDQNFLPHEAQMIKGS